MNALDATDDVPPVVVGGKKPPEGPAVVVAAVVFEDVVVASCDDAVGANSEGAPVVVPPGWDVEVEAPRLLKSGGAAGPDVEGVPPLP